MDSPAEDAASASEHAGVPVFASVLRYLLVGGASAVFELGLFQVMFQLTAHNVAISNPVAVTAATVLNYALNRSWAFKSRVNVARSAMLYLGLFLLNLAFSTAVIAQAVAMGALPIVAKAATMVCIVLWNFVLYRKVIFR